MIKLFDIEDGVVKETVHCQNIKWLRDIKEKYPTNYLKIYAYIFYLSCYSEENPYFNTIMAEREKIIIEDLDIDFSLDDDLIITAVLKATNLFTTPTIRAHRAISTMLDNMSTYMETTQITAGRDGNITALTRVAEKFDAIRQSYKGIAKDLAEEQKTITRGNQSLAYDQV